MSKFSFKNNKMESLIGFFSFLLLLTIASASTANAKKSDLKCLALNIFFEAQGEPRAGQIGVGMVTINRARSGLFQSSICGVVYARSQFSWTFDKYSNTPANSSAWSNALKLADSILDGKENDPTNKASHFYNPKKASPTWAKQLTYTATIGNHRFHRMRGFLKKLKVFKNEYTTPAEQDEYYLADLNESPDFQNLLLEQQIRTDAGDHAERFQQFLQYVDNLPDQDRELNMEDNPVNQPLDSRIIEL